MFIIMNNRSISELVSASTILKHIWYMRKATDKKCKKKLVNTGSVLLLTKIACLFVTDNNKLKCTGDG